MSVEKKTMVVIVDATPTWEETARMCVAILTNSDKPEAIKTARNELERMGRLLDACMKERKA